MTGKPDTELYELIKKFQSGDSHSGWLFIENKKIKQTIAGRLNAYRRMYRWIPEEDLLDIKHGLTPRIFEILKSFVLPEQPNDGRVLAYFSLRILGEADLLLKKITNIVQKVDDVTGKTFIISVQESIDYLEDKPSEEDFSRNLIEDIETQRKEDLLKKIFDNLPKETNENFWLRCYLLRIRGLTWAEIGKEVGYKQTDHSWLKDNTSRFITRIKQRLILIGEEVNYRILGIYTDFGEVSISLYDSVDKKRNFVWSKTYENYLDLDKIESKIGDIFRQDEVNYVLMNEFAQESKASVIIMRYLSKKEAYVETIDMKPFINFLPRITKSPNGSKITDVQKNAYLLSSLKKVWLDELRERSTKSKAVASGDSVSVIKNSGRS